MFALGAVSPWLSMVDETKYNRYVDGVQNLDIKTVAACHSPVIEGEFIAKAQETLPQFWQARDQHSHGESNFVLVVRITDKGRIEHFFTTDFERRDGKTMVTISHAPKIVSSVKPGDRIEIPAADITDWHFMRDGKYVGMTTFKARFKHMPAAQVEQVKKSMADP